ncbi:MAG TPA: TRAP transporter permease, partial [Burkholderiaceae bacterium]
MSQAADTGGHDQAFTPAQMAIAIAFSVFQIVTAAFSPLSSSVVRAVHVGFLLLLVFTLKPPAGRAWIGWGIGVAAFAAGLYHWVFE